MNNFQTILVAIFLAFFVFGVLIFSGILKLDSKTQKGLVSGKVVVWGTFPSSIMSNVIDIVDSPDLIINYVKKDSSTYQQDLIEAFANGKGPDLFFMTADMIKKNNNFVYKIPYTSYSSNTFKNAFIDGADIYLDNEGVIALPVIVDPMVMYFNRDILANEGIVAPPKNWDELFTLNSSLTKRESPGSGTIIQSMIALGQYSNIKNAKDIFATLLIQNNNSIVKRDGDSAYVSTLNSNTLNSAISPIESVIEFFVAFSNPADTSYSWNRSFPSSLDVFTANKMAFYLGHASEIFNIQEINPNLNFDVVQIPQVKNATTKRTFGDIYAVAINKKSSSINTAIGVANLFSQGDGAKTFSTSSSLPPASRVLLADKPTDNPYLFTFFNSALISRSWLDPEKSKSSPIFETLLENILSNKMSKGEAINRAQSQLELLLKK